MLILASSNTSPSKCLVTMPSQVRTCLHSTLSTREIVALQINKHNFPHEEFDSYKSKNTSIPCNIIY